MDPFKSKVWKERTKSEENEEIYSVSTSVDVADLISLPKPNYLRNRVVSPD